MTDGAGGLLPERLIADRLSRRASRLFVMFVVVFIASCALTAIARRTGTDLAAGTPYAWSGGTVFLHSEASGTTCELTDGATKTSVDMSRDTGAWAGVSGLDLTAAAEASIVCEQPVVVTGGAARIITYPARFAWVLVVVACLLFLAFLGTVGRLAVERLRGGWQRTGI
ncbi:hypothetical protein ACFQO7_24010 [Catellatospora aurea]|uniref:Uncharacterized protein n=1 Tax=Catellatospora aurea TaxID=1337874 RepID=A0ABW2GZU2_9ACTN